MNVADDFNTLASNAWLEAKQCLDKINMEEEKSVTFLCEILMVIIIINSYKKIMLKCSSKTDNIRIY